MMPSDSRRSPLLLPGEASTLLSVVGWLFGVTGVVMMAAMVSLLVGQALGWSVVADIPSSPAGTLLALAFGVGYVAVGLLLHRRRRLGAYIALALVLLRLFAMLLEPPDALGAFVVPALTVIAIVLAWPYLDKARDPFA